MLIQLFNDSIKFIDGMLLAEELAVLLQPILLPVHLKAAHAAFSKKDSCHWPSRHVQAAISVMVSQCKGFDKSCTVTGSYGAELRPRHKPCLLPRLVLNTTMCVVTDSAKLAYLDTCTCQIDCRCHFSTQSLQLLLLCAVHLSRIHKLQWQHRMHQPTSMARTSLR